MSKLIHSQSFSFYREILNDAKVFKYLYSLFKYHSETYYHSARVSLLSIDLGISNDLEDDIRILGYAGILHDIGKLEVPIEVLSKEGSLSPSERCIVSQHPRTGFNMMEDFNQDVRKIVVGHHEWKKDPYPRKEHRDSEGKRIQMLTQIVAAADIFDALESRRSYKEPMQKDEIEKIMRSDFKGDQNYVDQVLMRY